MKASNSEDHKARNSTRKTLFSLLLLAGLFVTLSGAKSRKKLHHDPDITYRKYMKKISRQLGVTCDYCHDVKNYRNTDNPKHKIALEHIRMVAWLNQEGFKSTKNVKADCYMCHRRQAKPAYKEKLGIGHD